MTSNDLKRPHSTSNENSKKTKTKNNIKGGSIQENIEINEHYSDKILQNNNSEMELATQIISNDKTVRKDTVNDLKEIINQSLATQAKKGEQLVSLMPAIKKAFDLMGDVIVDLSTENDASKSKIGDYDENWLEEPKTELLKQIDDETRANLIMLRMKKQMEKH